MWVDERPTRDWAAPQVIDDGASTPPRRRSAWITRGIPVLVIVAVLVVVWALGGFDKREDRTTKLRRGEQVTNGAYVFSFDRATIQRKKGYGDDPIVQEVVVHATAKNIWTESDSPNWTWFAATDRKRSVVKEGESVRIDYGDDAPSETPGDLTPGLPAMPIQIEFEFPENFEPGKELSLGMSEIDYRNHSVTSTSEEKTWGPSNKGFFRVELPVSVLPPDDDV